MFFLMRMTFWFSLVLLMLPFGGGDDGNQVGPLKALIDSARGGRRHRRHLRAQAGCLRDRQVGAPHTIGVRAQASAKIAYEMLGEPDEVDQDRHRHERRGG